MSYNEYYLVVDGAHDADIITNPIDDSVIMVNDPGSSPATLTEWLEDLEADAEHDKQPYEVYVIHHADHPIGDECECAQFETDHNPVWSRNV